MDIVYLGPYESVNVAPYGDHRKGQLKQYPDEFGADLIATSRKNRFESVTHEPKPKKVETKPDWVEPLIVDEPITRFPEKKKRKK